MNHAKTQIVEETGAGSLTLRVLEGSQQGAELIIAASTRLSIGASLDCDIIIDDAPDASTRLELTNETEVLQLQLVRGDVLVGGIEHVQGDLVALACAIPVRFGDAVFELVERTLMTDSDIGKEAVTASHLDDLLECESSDSDAVSSPSMPMTSRRHERQRRSMSLWSRSALGLGGTVALVWVITATGSFDGFKERSPSSAPLDAAGSKASLVRLIKQAELSHLSIIETAPQSFLIRGMVDTRSDRDRLKRLLRGRPEQIDLETSVVDDILDAVREVYRSSGVKAEVVSRGSGKVLVRTSVDDLDTLRQVESAVRADVPGLVSLQRNNQPPAIATEPMATTAPEVDEGKRVSLVVDGNPAFVMTADQSHYFIGSTLPSGHVIAAITGNQVTLEKDGEQSDLNF